MAVLNLSKVKENNFEPFPAGIYDLEVVEAEEREGKTSGNPYLNVQFAVPADADEHANRRVFCTMTYDEEKAFMLVGFLKSLGYTDEELENFNIDEEFMEQVVGMEVTAQVGIQKSEEYGDKNVIKRFIYSAEPVAVSGSDSDAF